jgi:hypothetical protein
MKKKLSWILFNTFFLSMFLSILILIIIDLNKPHGQPMRNCAMPGFTYLMTFFIILIFTICNSTIYLNVFKSIRENKWLCLLSFFLLPFIFFSYLFIFMFEDLSDEPSFFSALFLPFTLIYVFQYFRFRKWLKKDNSIELVFV